jgi:hemerythrin-like domain-containing protein
MELFDDLRHEHERIDAVLGALASWAERLVRGEAPLSDRDRFLRFLTVYAGAFHHEREEAILFPALNREADLPLDRGPILVLLEDHERMGAILRRLGSTEDPTTLHSLATAYTHALWQHIDIENSVFFPESEAQLRRAGVRAMGGRETSEEEREAMRIGEELVARYPSIRSEAIRGDGCVMCHAYGDTCSGMEREWWNAWEWEELAEHVAAS